MALQNGQIGGALGDLPTILAKLTLPQFKGLKAACKLSQVTNYAFILNKGAKIYPQVQSILTSLNSAGTLAALQKRTCCRPWGAWTPIQSQIARTSADTAPACAGPHGGGRKPLGVGSTPVCLRASGQSSLAEEQRTEGHHCRHV